ncbi:hypothetical protein KKA13_01020 [Patescibacteria group bacterium]|nr:hypothetical protein [Patescibacteria group bacterium]MBU1613464.1 hypothetical protein [Patescibacteria group bacterium]
MSEVQIETRGVVPSEYHPGSTTGEYVDVDDLFADITEDEEGREEKRTQTSVPPDISIENIVAYEKFLEGEFGGQNKPEARQPKFHLAIPIETDGDHGYDIEPDETANLLIKKLNFLSLGFFLKDDPNTTGVTTKNFIHVPGDGQNIELAKKITERLNDPEFEQKIEELWLARQGFKIDPLKKEIEDKKNKIFKTLAKIKGEHGTTGRKLRQTKQARLLETPERYLNDINESLKGRIFLAKEAIALGQSLGIKNNTPIWSDSDMLKSIIQDTNWI